MKWKSNKLTDLRKQYIEALTGQYGKNEGKQLTDILIEHFFGITKLQLALNPEKRLSESEMLQLHYGVKDLLNHKPVQYITGSTTFLDLKLLVNESVLIPRPETEELVQLILKNEKNKHAHFIDIGTGSGCMALAIKKNLPEVKITAVDISREALKVAEENARMNGLEIDFQFFDILNPDSYVAFPKYDVVVSNPPYVLESDKEQMPKNVLEHEPAQALFVDDDNALLFYKAILDFCQDHLARHGRVYFEINERKGAETVTLLTARNYGTIRLHKDIHGKNRFVSSLKK